jgi:hypothetical protein
VHPAADMFPMMSDAELAALAADIAEHGLREPIAWHTKPGSRAKPQLLDGRNRLAAIDRIGEPKRRQQLKTQVNPDTGYLCRVIHDEPYVYVVSANLHRRHLTPAQKRELIAKLLEAGPSQSDRGVTKLAQVDGKTVGQVRADMERRAEIPHVETRTDAAGRQQPASRPRREIEAAEEHEQTDAPSLNPQPRHLVDDLASKIFNFEMPPGFRPRDFSSPIIEGIAARLRDLLDQSMEQTPFDTWPALFWRLHEEIEAAEDRVFPDEIERDEPPGDDGQITAKGGGDAR